MPEYKLFAPRVRLVGIVSLLVRLSGLILLPILTKTLERMPGKGRYARVKRKDKILLIIHRE